MATMTHAAFPTDAISGGQTLDGPFALDGVWLLDGSGSVALSSFSDAGSGSANNAFTFNYANAAGSTTGQCTFIYANSASATFDLTARL